MRDVQFYIETKRFRLTQHFETIFFQFSSESIFRHETHFYSLLAKKNLCENLITAVELPRPCKLKPFFSVCTLTKNAKKLSN